MSRRKIRLMRLLVLFSLIVGLMLVAFIPHNNQTVDITPRDGGVLALANATAILNGESMPIIQRGPGLGVFYSGLGVIAQVNPLDVRYGDAQEIGNPQIYPIAQDFLNDNFLRIIHLSNLFFWFGTLTITLLILHWFQAPIGVYLLAILAALASPNWQKLTTIDDIFLAGFLLALGVLALILAWRRHWQFEYLLLAGVVFAIVALVRVGYQLFTPTILLVLLVPAYRHQGWHGVLRVSVTLLVPYALIVGSWVYRNAHEHEFIGVSGVSGIALSTRTVDTLHTTESVYPDYVPQFLNILNERLTYNHETYYWGEQASALLIRRYDMNYVEANQLLAEINLNAIKNDPFRYAETVVMSFIKYNFSGLGWDTNSRPLMLAELALISSFGLSIILWGSYRLLAWLSPLVPQKPFTEKTLLIVVLFVLYLYTGILSSAVDVGNYRHRYPAEFAIPIVVYLVLRILEIIRLNKAQQSIK